MINNFVIIITVIIVFFYLIVSYEFSAEFTFPSFSFASIPSFSGPLLLSLLARISWFLPAIFALTLLCFLHTTLSYILGPYGHLSPLKPVFSILMKVEDLLLLLFLVPFTNIFTESHSDFFVAVMTFLDILCISWFGPNRNVGVHSFAIILLNPSVLCWYFQSSVFDTVCCILKVRIWIFMSSDV